MTVIDMLTRRNQTFVENGFEAGLSMMPQLRAMIITCADPRVDPAHLLGLKSGEAAVIRNVGGRMTPGTLQNMALLQLVGQSQGAPSTANFDLIILHHTDCGITHLEHKPDLLAAYFGIDKTELGAKAIHDPYAAVVIDVAALKANPMLPATWSVSGLVYDVATGHVETVVPPASRSS
ncbi:MAG: carbonic anhydrase [Anaerolineae bacterium]